MPAADPTADPTALLTHLYTIPPLLHIVSSISLIMYVYTPQWPVHAHKGMLHSLMQSNLQTS